MSQSSQHLSKFLIYHHQHVIRKINFNQIQLLIIFHLIDDRHIKFRLFRS